MTYTSCPLPASDSFSFLLFFTHGYCITDLYGDDAEEPEAKRENRALCVSSISILLLSFQKIKKWNRKKKINKIKNSTTRLKLPTCVAIGRECAIIELEVSDTTRKGCHYVFLPFFKYIFFLFFPPFISVNHPKSIGRDDESLSRSSSSRVSLLPPFFFVFLNALPPNKKTSSANPRDRSEEVTHRSGNIETQHLK